jgi:hypothetical protein
MEVVQATFRAFFGRCPPHIAERYMFCLHTPPVVPRWWLIISTTNPNQVPHFSLSFLLYTFFFFLRERAIVHLCQDTLRRTSADTGDQWACANQRCLVRCRGFFGHLKARFANRRVEVCSVRGCSTPSRTEWNAVRWWGVLHRTLHTR